MSRHRCIRGRGAAAPRPFLYPGLTGSELFIVDNSDEDWKDVRYHVCEKWLKDRKSRTLTQEDIAHFQKIVALSETIHVMAEIDRVIDAHGGWPGAFQTAANA